MCQERKDALEELQVEREHAAKTLQNVSVEYLQK
jgi:hypothetical protein